MGKILTARPHVHAVLVRDPLHVRVRYVRAVRVLQVERYGRALPLRVAEALPVVVLVYAAQRPPVGVPEAPHPVVQPPRQPGRVPGHVLHRAV